jgi:4-hydroxy-2-oxoheptanedioate aldolase
MQMRQNALCQAWAQGRRTANGWLSIPSSFAAEVMAHQGWDSLTIDLQHGVVDYQTAVGMLQAISTTEAVPMVRVPWLDPGIVMKMLDAGSYGVICPMINNAAEAETFVCACRYPPRGNRSMGPIRATLYAGEDYVRHANETVLAIAMIETAQALDDLDGILATEGLDGIYVGPSDLANALGCPPVLDPVEPKVTSAVEQVLRAAKKAGLWAGIHTGAPAYARRMHQLGFDFISLASDSRLLALKSQESLAEIRGAAAPSGGARTY